jgi:serine/threonine protein kinase
MFHVVNALKKLHSVGYTHNDMKPSNIMLSETFDATLIDFGYSKKYINENNSHMKKCCLDSFQGNILFSSYSQQMFYSTSRKDDLISVSYNLFTLLNQNHFPLC